MAPGPAKQFCTDEALRQAMNVFWARGYEAASLSELMDAMGIGKKSLYDTYGNKRSLFLKACRQYGRDLSTQLRSKLLDSGSPLENLQKMFRMWASEHSKCGSGGCFIGTNIADFDSTDEEVAEALRKNLQIFEDVVHETIVKAQKLGEVQESVKAREFARMLTCLSQGAALVSRVVDSRAVFDGCFNTALTMLEAH